VSVLRASGIAKTFRGGDGGTLAILNGVNLEVRRGEMVAVVGASGAGKSTLLHVLGALDRPNRGEVWIDGESIDGRTDDELAILRTRKVGFVFQFHHLLREFSALENVMMPLRIGGMSTIDARARAEKLLDRVGLTPRRDHHPSQLSGGEQQRTAVARALATDPAILLADEPSGNLDHGNAERLHDLLSWLARDLEIAMVVVTHNASLAARASRTMVLADGVLAETADKGVVA
jgi:lipoprotein-releasing system ATP-binding protein